MDRPRFHMPMEGTSSCPVVKINATEVASAIGLHEHKTKNQAMQKVWERTDYQTFCVANALENEEEVIAIIDRHWKQAASDEEKNDFSQILFLDWDKQEETVVKMLTEIFPEPGVSPKSSFLPLKEEIYKLIRSKTDPDFRAEVSLREAEVTRNDIDHEVRKLAQNEKKAVSESVKEICDSKNIKEEETRRAVRSVLSKKRGEALEDRPIMDFQVKNKTKVKQPKKLFKKDVEYEGVKWTIQGIIDGHHVKEDQIVEVKNRTRRYYCEDYDRIQLQTYMFICDKQKGLFLERLNGKQKETVFKFREQDWNQEVVPALKKFVAELTSQIETYRELVEDNKHYYVNFVTPPRPPPRPFCKRPLEDSVNSTKKEKIPHFQGTQVQDSEPFESLSQ